jgi:hypothetical protein
VRLVTEGLIRDNEMMGEVLSDSRIVASSHGSRDGS